MLFLLLFSFVVCVMSATSELNVESTSDREGQLHVWSPYGSGTPDNRLLGFNGERVDPVSGTYHLGNDYRAYSPVLMRFNCPDSLSPFGAGGINPYAYCAGDPINHTDPSGHLMGLTGMAVGIGMGLRVYRGKTGYRYRGDSYQGHSIYEEAWFQDVNDAVVREVKNRRISPKWYINEYNNALKFGADTQITCSDITFPIKHLSEIKGDKRSIIILSAVHGDKFGANWTRVKGSGPPGPLPRVIRSPWQYEPDFWVEDVEKFIGNEQFKSLRSRISVVDISEMSVYKFRDIIRSDSHVILGFCFGRNDKAYRYYLGINSVISYVNPSKL